MLRTAFLTHFACESIYGVTIGVSPKFSDRLLFVQIPIDQNSDHQLLQKIVCRPSIVDRCHRCCLSSLELLSSSMPLPPFTTAVASIDHTVTVVVDSYPFMVLPSCRLPSSHCYCRQLTPSSHLACSQPPHCGRHHPTNHT